MFFNRRDQGSERKLFFSFFVSVFAWVTWLAPDLKVRRSNIYILSICLDGELAPEVHYVL